ncbi:hypothetical protein [Hamadaea tsunoensis]|uniref:hypothetical protein n=1 Tax=Hamadaea tsunoensis TaxID=53368 RepID=UPI000427F02E|nr:hypothetical protein [Hamadaea tsunoensis]
MGAPVVGSAALGDVDGWCDVALGETAVSDSEGDGETVVSDAEGDGDSVVSDSDGDGLASVGLGEALWDGRADLLGYGEWLDGVGGWL